MERRDAIKTILAYSLGSAVLSGWAAACATEEWKPLFLQPTDAFIVESLGEAILPETDTPGARAVGAHKFVDVFLAKAATPEEQARWKAGIDRWQGRFTKQLGRPVTEATAADFQTNLQHYLSVNDQRQAEIKALLSRENAPEDPAQAEDYHTYHFLFTLKHLIMLGFYASEPIGEDVLTYLPIPGRYEACVPVESVGRAWSL